MNRSSIHWALAHVTGASAARLFFLSGLACNSSHSRAIALKVSLRAPLGLAGVAGIDARRHQLARLIAPLSGKTKWDLRKDTEGQSFLAAVNAVFEPLPARSVRVHEQVQTIAVGQLVRLLRWLSRSRNKVGQHENYRRSELGVTA